MHQTVEASLRPNRKGMAVISVAPGLLLAGAVAFVASRLASGRPAWRKPCLAGLSRSRRPSSPFSLALRSTVWPPGRSSRLVLYSR